MSYLVLAWQANSDPLVARMVSSIAGMSNPVSTAVLVTSLQQHQYEYLKEVYSEGQTLDGSLLAFHV